MRDVGVASAVDAPDRDDVEKILKTGTESETVRAAIDMIAFREEVMRGYDRVAGKSPDFGDIWKDR